MTGIVIIGIASGVIGASVFMVIPAMKDRTAVSSLRTIHMAQTSYFQGTGQYGTINQLVEEKLLENSYKTTGTGNISDNKKICIKVTNSGKAYVAETVNDPNTATKKYYQATNNSNGNDIGKQVTTRSCF